MTTTTRSQNDDDLIKGLCSQLNEKDAEIKEIQSKVDAITSELKDQADLRETIEQESEITAAVYAMSRAMRRQSLKAVVDGAVFESRLVGSNEAIDDLRTDFAQLMSSASSRCKEDTNSGHPRPKIRLPQLPRSPQSRSPIDPKQTEGCGI